MIFLCKDYPECKACFASHQNAEKIIRSAKLALQVTGTPERIIRSAKLALQVTGTPERLSE